MLCVHSTRHAILLESDMFGAEQRVFFQISTQNFYQNFIFAQKSLNSCLDMVQWNNIVL